MLNILNHNFYDEAYAVTINSATYFDEESKEEISVKFFEPNEIPDAMNYAHGCLTAFLQLSDSIKELFIPALVLTKEQVVTEILQLVNSEIPDFSNWKGYRRSDTVGFLLKSWVNRYITCIEVCFVLVNEVLALSLKGMALNPDNVINRIDKSSKCYSPCSNLKNLREHIFEIQNELSIRKINNEIKHQGRFHHRGLSDITTYELFYEIFNLNNKLLDVDPDKEIRMIYKTIVGKSDEVCEHIVLVLDEMVSPFKERFEKMKKDIHMEP